MFCFPHPQRPQRPRKLELQRQKEAYERQVREAERKREMEREKAEKREQALGGLETVGDRKRFQAAKDPLPKNAIHGAGIYGNSHQYTWIKWQ